MIIKIINKQRRIWHRFEVFVDGVLKYKVTEKYLSVFRITSIREISTAERAATIKVEILSLRTAYKIIRADGSKLRFKFATLMENRFICKCGEHDYSVIEEDEYNYAGYKDNDIQAKWRITHKSIFAGPDYTIAAYDGADVLLLTAFCLAAHEAVKHKPDN